MEDTDSASNRSMTVLESDAFLLFVTLHCSSNDIYNIAKVMSLGPTVDSELFECLSDLKIKPDMEILNDSVLLKNSNLTKMIQTLYYKGYQSLAESLHCCYQKCLKGITILRMSKIQTENKRKISLYFKNIKKLVHEMAFKNPSMDVQSLGKIMRQNIELESDSVRKMFLCDKYIAIKAAEMDALTNVEGVVSPNHEGYNEIESFITSASNPSISQVILYGRKADALSTVGQFEEGADLFKAAYIAADCSVPCVEISDMIYKSVVFKLSEFERYPTEDLKKSVLLEANRGIWSLNEEPEDMRLFWKRLFILTMVFCHLGIGKFCVMIKNYVPNEKSVVEAERLLESGDLTDMEHRRMMFYYTAKSRLNQWKGDLSLAISHIQKAKQFAWEGNYIEYSSLKCYESELETLKQQNQNWEQTFDETKLLDQPAEYLEDWNLSDVEISFNSILVSTDSDFNMSQQ